MNLNANATTDSKATVASHVAFGRNVLVWAGLLCWAGCVGPGIQPNQLPLPTAKAVPHQPGSERDLTPAFVEPPLEDSIPAAIQIEDADEPTVAPATEPTTVQDADAEPDFVVRGQASEEVMLAPGDDGLYRDAMPASGVNSAAEYDPQVRLAQYTQQPANNGFNTGGTSGYTLPPPGETGPIGSGFDTYGGVEQLPSQAGVLEPLPGDYADLVVNLRETQTGRFMFGVGVNSDLGLTAQAIIDERHFDWRRWPRNLDDIINGTAWRGGGQALRIEAVPGTEVQRYLINFTQPYLCDTPISFNLSGYLYDRRYFDWDEQRLGGRVGLGYRITPDLSLGVSLRAEQVDFHDPRVRGIPIIEEVLGESDLFSGRIALTHDTRDIPFAPTEGHYLELSFEQVFGTFDYPRGNIDYRRYFLLRQRADRSGRHTLGFSFKGGITGSQTPVYENYFAGGYSTLRGFRFRHASPKIMDVIVGGQLSMLGSAEYIFPITADDMLRGALFCDYGTIEESYDDIDIDDFRVAIGTGLRITVPAMGPAPIAVDFAIPLAREGTDRIQNFSFFVGFGR